MSYFTFNGISKDYVVLLKDFSKPAWASVSREFIELNGNAISILANTKTEIRQITIPILIKHDTRQDLYLLEEDLGKWLVTDSACPLTFYDEPNRMYYAVVSDTFDPERLAKLGHGEITFLCYDPYKYNTTEKTYTLTPNTSDASTVISEYTFTNDGNAPVFPKLKVTFGQSETNFSVISGQKQLIFGGSEVDATVTEKETQVFRDEFSTLNTATWSAATAIDNGTITGNFASNGESVSPAYTGGAWGTGTSWHGPSLVCGLNTQLTNFRVRCRIGNKIGQIGQIGRVEFYLLDANGNQFAKIAFKNANKNANRPSVDFWVKDTTFANKLVSQETFGDYAGIWQDFDDGFIEIQREDNVWTFYVAQYDAVNAIEHTRYSYKWTDTNNEATTSLGQVQIHIGAHGTSYGPSTIYITDLKVFQVNTAAEGTIYYSFVAGDVLEIDNNTGAIYLNGSPYYSTLLYSSRFVHLDPGDNTLIVSPNTFADLEVSYRERWK